MVKKSKKTSIKRQKTGSSPVSLSAAKKSSKTKQRPDAADDVVIDERITWEDIAAMSDSDDGEDDGAEMEVVLNAKAKSLRQAINDGRLNEVLASLSKAKSNGGDDDEEFEEDVLDSSSEEEDEEAAIEEELVVDDSVDEQENDEEDDEENEDTEDDDDSDGNLEEDGNGAAEENMEAAIVMKSGKQNISVELGDDEDDDGDEEDEVGDEDDEEGDEEDGEGDEKDEGEVNSEEEVDEKIQKYNQLETNNHTNSKALSVVIAELAATHSKLHWAEKFVIVPPSPLPFGGNGNAESNPLDIHDDLKREVAFYNTALEAVNIARLKCKEAGVPFARPEDFFAEMVKTDGKFKSGHANLIPFYFYLSWFLIMGYPTFSLKITWQRSRIVSSLKQKRLKLCPSANLIKNKSFVQRNLNRIV